MATLTAMPGSKIRGGSFLIEERTSEEVFTPEDFSEQHQLIAQTAEEFANKEIVPNIEKMEHKDFAVIRELVRKAGELGLSGVDVPEQYGGLEMDKVTSSIIADRIAKYGGFSASWGAHTCIGTLPIVYFGTEQQKKKYLPGLAAVRKGRRLCTVRIMVRLRRVALPNPSPTFGRRAALRTERRKDVDYERRLRRSLHRLRESRWREIHGFPDRTRFSRFLRGRRRAQDGDPRLVDLSLNS